MIYEFESPEKWNEAKQLDPDLEGYGSPGPVAAELGITRQAVYNAVKRGKLDMVRIKPPRFNDVGIIFITTASVERYIQTAGTRGRRPTRQSQIKLLKDYFLGAR